MHALSLGTWFIHIATLFEWTLAIVLINLCSRYFESKSLNWLAIAMIPNLASAMAAITWHIYDNSYELKGLVVLQAGLTMLGNTCMAIASWNLYKSKGEFT